MQDRKKNLRRDILSIYGGDSENTSALNESKLYDSADEISDSVRSFFADEEERKQKHGVKKLKFKGLLIKKSTMIKKKFKRGSDGGGAANLSAADDSFGKSRALSIDEISLNRSQKYQKNRVSVGGSFDSSRRSSEVLQSNGISVIGGSQS